MSEKPLSILKRWMKEKSKKLPDLARETGYSYIHLWKTIKGREPISDAFLGRLMICYLQDGPAPAMAEHMRHLLENTNGKGK